MWRYSCSKNDWYMVVSPSRTSLLARENFIPVRELFSGIVWNCLIVSIRVRLLLKRVCQVVQREQDDSTMQKVGCNVKFCQFAKLFTEGMVYFNFALFLRRGTSSKESVFRWKEGSRGKWVFWSLLWSVRCDISSNLNWKLKCTRHSC